MSCASEDEHVDSWRYLGIYSSILTAGVFCQFLQALIWVPSHMGAITAIHQTALWAVLRSPMAYFDTTVKGRIVNRCVLLCLTLSLLNNAWLTHC